MCPPCSSGPGRVASLSGTIQFLTLPGTPGHQLELYEAVIGTQENVEAVHDP